MPIAQSRLASVLAAAAAYQRALAYAKAMLELEASQRPNDPWFTSMLTQFNTEFRVEERHISVLAIEAHLLIRTEKRNVKRKEAMQRLRARQGHISHRSTAPTHALDVSTDRLAKATPASSAWKLVQEDLKLQGFGDFIPAAQHHATPPAKLPGQQTTKTPQQPATMSQSEQDRIAAIAREVEEEEAKAAVEIAKQATQGFSLGRLRSQESKSNET